jgi:hypothetical protein
MTDHHGAAAPNAADGRSPANPSVDLIADLTSGFRHPIDARAIAHRPVLRDHESIVTEGLPPPWQLDLGSDDVPVALARLSQDLINRSLERCEFLEETTEIVGFQ